MPQLVAPLARLRVRCIVLTEHTQLHLRRSDACRRRRTSSPRSCSLGYFGGVPEVLVPDKRRRSRSGRRWTLPNGLPRTEGMSAHSGHVRQQLAHWDTQCETNAAWLTFSRSVFPGYWRLSGRARWGTARIFRFMQSTPRGRVGWVKLPPHPSSSLSVLDGCLRDTWASAFRTRRLPLMAGRPSG